MQKLTIAITLVLLSAAASANVSYVCENKAKTTLDMFGAEKSNIETASLDSKSWIVDTAKGWRRSDNPVYRGKCKLEKGYTVCKAEAPFGEATFSIHPDDSGFLLVYIDYGLDLLAFTGNCTKG